MALHTSPTPRDLLDGVVRALQRDVAPHLDDPTARDQLASALGILRYVSARWDAAVPDLAREADELHALFAEAIPALREAGREDLAARLEGATAAGPPDLTAAYGDRAAHADALQQALLELFLAVDRAAEAAQDEQLAALRPSVLGALEAVTRRRA